MTLRWFCTPDLLQGDLLQRCLTAVTGTNTSPTFSSELVTALSALVTESLGGQELHTPMIRRIASGAGYTPPVRGVAEVHFHLTDHPTLSLNIENEKWEGIRRSFVGTAGTVVFCDTTVVRQEPRNHSDHEKVVLVLLVGKASRLRYEWEELPYGTPSYYQCLVRNQVYRPLSLISDRRKRKRDREYMKIYQLAEELAEAQGYRVQRPVTGELRPAKRTRV